MQDDDLPQPQATDGGVVAMILEKRTTRTHTYYKVHVISTCIFEYKLISSLLSQVAWLGKEDVDASWVSAHTLPKDVVQEYEHGVRTQVAVHQTVQYGPLFTTAYIDRAQDDSAESPPKRARFEEWTPETSG